MTIQAYTLATFRSEIRERLNESAAAGVWSDAEISGHINRALLRTVLDTEIDSAEATITTRANVAWYDLPTDCLVPLFLYGPSAWAYERIFPTSLGALDKNVEHIGRWELTSGGISRLFIPFGYDKFIIWPPPSSAVSITLFYVPEPATMDEDADTTNVHLHAQDLVPVYATYLALRKYDFKKARILLSEYKQRLASVKSEQATNAASRPVRMAPATAWDRAHGNPVVRMC